VRRAEELLVARKRIHLLLAAVRMLFITLPSRRPLGLAAAAAVHLIPVMVQRPLEGHRIKAARAAALAGL
jgi:hypothetical protein